MKKFRPVSVGNIKGGNVLPTSTTMGNQIPSSKGLNHQLSAMIKDMSLGKSTLVEFMQKLGQISRASNSGESPSSLPQLFKEEQTLHNHAMDIISDKIESELENDLDYSMPVDDLRRLTMSVCCINVSTNNKRSLNIDPSFEQIKMLKSLQRLCIRF